MCEYLFAQFTLKRSPEEGLSDQEAKVAAWEQVLIDVIKQEMLHLALTTNLLTAIGAAPHLHQPNFPILSRWYPPGVQLALVPSANKPCGISSTWNAPRGWRGDGPDRRRGLRRRRPGPAPD